jgi:clan AA aspartic protease
MGITTVLLRVKEHRKAEKFADVEFIVDSGAVYSLVPGKILDELGIEPYKEVSSSLADGTIIKRCVGDAYFEYKDEGGAASVIYGEEGDAPLLGATTLEALGLVLNPFTRTLHPMRMLLADYVQEQNDKRIFNSSEIFESEVNGIKCIWTDRLHS